MSWFGVAVLSYVLLAVVNLTDKFLIDNVVKSAKTYTLLVCGLSLVIFLGAPWFLVFPGWSDLLVTLASGSLFTAAIFFMYEALRRGEATRTVIVIGGLVPVFAVILSTVFLKAILSVNQLWGLGLLVIGTFLIAFLPVAQSFWEKMWARLHPDKYRRQSWRLAILSSFFFAAFFVATKQVYEYQPFWSAFMWLRLGAFLAAGLFLLEPRSRHEIIRQLFPQKKKKKKKSKTTALFLFNQGLGALSSVLQNYAIFLGPVALVTALQGVQYGVLIILSFVLGLFIKQYREDFSWRSLLQKIFALLLISGGLYLIAIQI